MIHRGKVDAFDLDRGTAQNIIASQGVADIKPATEPIESIDYYLLLNKKHAAIVPLLAKALSAARPNPR